MSQAGGQGNQYDARKAEKISLHSAATIVSCEFLSSKRFGAIFLRTSGYDRNSASNLTSAKWKPIKSDLTSRRKRKIRGRCMIFHTEFFCSAMNSINCIQEQTVTIANSSKTATLPSIPIANQNDSLTLVSTGCVYLGCPGDVGAACCVSNRNFDTLPSRVRWPFLRAHRLTA